jgi:DNA polymerase epsilon subunit 1
MYVQVERIGIPLELDTDGIWCCLPKSFPDGIEFKVRTFAPKGKIYLHALALHVPVCMALNYM